MAAGTKTGLHSTRIGVATIKAITVPVRVNPDNTNSAAPIVPAVINFSTALREVGCADDCSYLDMTFFLAWHALTRIKDWES